MEFPQSFQVAIRFLMTDVHMGGSNWPKYNWIGFTWFSKVDPGKIKVMYDRPEVDASYGCKFYRREMSFYHEGCLVAVITVDGSQSIYKGRCHGSRIWTISRVRYLTSWTGPYREYWKKLDNPNYEEPWFDRKFSGYDKAPVDAVAV